jgi:hypothetical protein
MMPDPTQPPGVPPDGEPPGRPRGRRLDAALSLLDRQLVDRDGRLAGKVDDVELVRRPDGVLEVGAVLCGPGALGPRLPGLIGRLVLAVWRRMHADLDPEPARIPFTEVVEIGAAVTLSSSRVDLPNQDLETWMCREIVGKLPGASHE